MDCPMPPAAPTTVTWQSNTHAMEKGRRRFAEVQRCRKDQNMRFASRQTAAQRLSQVQNKTIRKLDTQMGG